MIQLPCSAFRKNPDGSWTTVQAVTIQSPMGTVQLGPGQTFRPGVQFFGLDLGAWLNANCR